MDESRFNAWNCAACGKAMDINLDDHVDLTAFSMFRAADKLPCHGEHLTFHRHCYQALAVQAPWLPPTSYDKINTTIYSDGRQPSRPRTADELPPPTIPVLPESSPAPFVDGGTQ